MNQSNSDNINESLAQQLLELHYGLLDDTETQELHKLIATDANVAEAWAKTLRMAGQFADAARLEVASKQIVIAPPVQLPQGALDAAAAKVPEETADSAEVRLGNSDDNIQPRSRGGWALWTIAASLMFAFVGFRHFNRLPQEPAYALRIQAEADVESTEGNRVKISTSRLVSGATGTRPSKFKVVPASISISILSSGVSIFEKIERTSQDGILDFVVPSQVTIPEGSRLRIASCEDSGGETESAIFLPLEPTRCLTYLTIDKPVYRPGETIWFRSLTLERSTMKPKVDLPIRFEFSDPSDATVRGGVFDGVTDRGVGNGSFTIPAEAAGGQYKLTVRSLDDFFPDEVREIQVRKYRTPRFKKALEFQKRSYGQGDRVKADFTAERAEGGAVAGGDVRVVATVDGETVHDATGKTDGEGAFAIEFALPTYIREGKGNLSVSIFDGGTRETQTKTLPIQLSRVDVEFYPEGGYLVSDLQNRVYFTARNMLGEPIHIEGEVLSQNGSKVADLVTTRDGMGKFEITPSVNQSYVLKVKSPVDVSNSPALPVVVKGLPVMDTGSGVFGKQEDISFTVRQTKARPLIVQAVCRGKLIHRGTTEFGDGDTTISIPATTEAHGVIRLTVLDPTTLPPRPLVERLVYRESSKRLSVRVTDASRESTVSAETPEGEGSMQHGTGLRKSPRDQVRLTLEVVDENGESTPGVIGVSVVDDAALSLDDVRRPSIFTHFMLTSEVQKPEDLEHAEFYLSGSAEARESLDLLLGTQGWRRFAAGGPGSRNEDFREQLARLLKLDGPDSESRPVDVDNVALVNSQLKEHLSQIGVMWTRFWRELGFMLLPLLCVWLLSVWIRPKHQTTVAAGLLIMLAASWPVMVGCGARSPTASMEMDQASAGPSQEMPARNRDGQEDDVFETPADQGSGAALVPSADQIEVIRRRIEGMLFDGKPLVESDTGEGAAMGDSAQTGSDRLITEEDLRQLLSSRGLDADALARQLLDELRFPVREYAHRASRKSDGVREDFAETLYWQPMLLTDSTGKATVRFDLSDSITTFRLLADAHGGSGHLGSGECEISTHIPLQIEPKLPLEVATGDRIDLPVAIVNATDHELAVDLNVTAGSALRILDDDSISTSLAGQSRNQQHISLDVVGATGNDEAMIELSLQDKERGFSDRVRRGVRVASSGYPIRESYAGVIEGTHTLKVPLPKATVDGSLRVQLRAYPSPLADLLTGVESILREPHGCFEQTSATNYPNAMVLKYLESSSLSNAEVSTKAKKLLGRGYKKLTSFECQELGYEWFGSDPGHEALSAFGLMQFTDMSAHMEIDTAMMDRTRNWLLQRRDGEGGFKRNPRHLHVWSVDQEIINAYVLWALTEADVAAGNRARTVTELKSELDHLESLAKQSKDPYFIALAAASLLNAQRDRVGEGLLLKLVELQREDGSLDGKTTVTQSGGISRQVETTALAVLAWTKSPRFSPPARLATQWIVKNRQGHGGFGSTQATVLALKALVAYSNRSTSGDEGGIELKVMRDGEVLASVRSEEASRDSMLGSETLEIAGLGDLLADGDSVELVATGTQSLPYTIEVLYHVQSPPSHPECPLELKAKLVGGLKEGTVGAGDSLRMNVELKNTQDAGLPMTVGVVGIPGGMEPRAEQLDEMKAAGVFDFYELRPREVICYWRTFKPSEVKSFEFDVTAEIPGEYTGPASRAYLYYTAEQKMWTTPVKVEIVK